MSFREDWVAARDKPQELLPLVIQLFERPVVEAWLKEQMVILGFAFDLTHRQAAREKTLSNLSDGALVRGNRKLMAEIDKEGLLKEVAEWEERIKQAGMVVPGVSAWFIAFLWWCLDCLVYGDLSRVRRLEQALIKLLHLGLASLEEMLDRGKQDPLLLSLWDESLELLALCAQQSLYPIVTQHWEQLGEVSDEAQDEMQLELIGLNKGREWWLGKGYVAAFEATIKPEDPNKDCYLLRSLRQIKKNFLLNYLRDNPDYQGMPYSQLEALLGQYSEDGFIEVEDLVVEGGSSSLGCFYQDTFLLPEVPGMPTDCNIEHCYAHFDALVQEDICPPCMASLAPAKLKAVKEILRAEKAGYQYCSKQGVSMRQALTDYENTMRNFLWALEQIERGQAGLKACPDS